MTTFPRVVILWRNVLLSDLDILFLARDLDRLCLLAEFLCPKFCMHHGVFKLCFGFQI